MQRPLLLVVVVLILVAGGGVRAQADSPLIIQREGNLHLLFEDGTTRLLTNRQESLIRAYALDRRNVYPAPGGRHLVYRDVPLFAAEAWNNNETGNVGELPTDLFLIDLASGEQTQIAAHTPGMRWRQGEMWYRAAFGHGAAWSLDGMHFAYVETTPSPSGSRYRWWMLDVASGRIIQVAEADDTWSGTFRLHWTAYGLAIGTTVYNLRGEIASQTFLPETVLGEYLVHYDGRDLITLNPRGSVLEDGTVYMMDIRSGEYFTASGYVTVVSAFAPETSLRLLDYTNDTRPRSVVTPRGQFVFAEDGQAPYAADFVLSPDGARFAYEEVGVGARGSVIMDAAGEEHLLEATQVVGWGAPLYTLAHGDGDAILEPSAQWETPEACGSLPPAGLVRGGAGVVLGTTPNRLRSAPDVDAEVLGNIRAGESFSVMDAQQGICNDGIRWAQVWYEGIVGWTAEGFEGTRFVAPG